MTFNEWLNKELPYDEEEYPTGIPLKEKEINTFYNIYVKECIKVGSIITSKDDPLNNIGIVEEIKNVEIGELNETIITARQRGFLVARNSRNIIDLTDRLIDIVKQYC